MHRSIEPAIHYWGTPVVLVSTLNGTARRTSRPCRQLHAGLDASSQTVIARAAVRAQPRVCQQRRSGEPTREDYQARVPLHKRALGYTLAAKAQHAELTWAS